MYRPFQIVVTVEIRKNRQCLLNGRRVELLKHILSEGSILAASKAMRMSYQQAWDIIKDLNVMASLPVVSKQRGGVHGGGAVVTPFGLTLIERFSDIENKHRQYASEMEKTLDICLS
jgi:molybdate transport system regulatory protein